MYCISWYLTARLYQLQQSLSRRRLFYTLVRGVSKARIRKDQTKQAEHEIFVDYFTHTTLVIAIKYYANYCFNAFKKKGVTVNPDC